MKIYVVLDTNVLVAAMLTRNSNSATRRIINAVTESIITPIYHQDILEEYQDVLNREKFGFTPDDVKNMLDVVASFGVRSNRIPTDEYFPDKDDVVFYEVALSKEGAYLVTGNIKDFPQKPIVVTPAEMIKILEDNGLINPQP